MSGDNVRLRGYRAGDLNAMYALDVECFAAEFRFSRALMKQYAEAKKARVSIAESDGVLVGFGILHLERVAESSQRLGYVMTIDVAPQCRRRGLARRLMDAMEREASDAGCEWVVLHVFVGNDVAIGFYECAGYERTAKVHGFYGRGLDAWIYRKRLPGWGA
jgi:[ribosomal protein S18]-alanine N-acetyltransferase